MKKISLISSVLVLCCFALISWQTQQDEVMVRGKKVYNLYCLSCHAADGSGMENLNPPLIKTKGVTGDKSKLIGIILKGMNVHEPINGKVYTNTMAPLDYLTDQQISDVLTYIRKSFGNKASAVTPGEVKAEREKLNE